MITGMFIPHGGTVNMDHEQTLVHLMKAEVLSWQLRNNLKKRNDEQDYSIVPLGARLHEEVLRAASDAIPVLGKHPNQRLVKLLITHLETYPYSWTEEGYEDLLLNLRSSCMLNRSERERRLTNR